MDVFPDAKVILTVRDPERWYKSVKNSIMKIRQVCSLPHVRLFLTISGSERATKIVNKSSNMKPKGSLKKGNENIFNILQVFLAT